MREVKPTQKPVPSSDIKDLFFNSGLLDIWATSLEHKYIDRFGNCHLTAAGMEWLFKELVETFKVDMNIAIVAAGYITIDSFQQGADLPNNELTQRNHILRDETTGEYYRWDGDLPKQVPAGSTPQSTGGIGKGAWVSVGDASLRSEIYPIIVDSTSSIEQLSPTTKQKIYVKSTSSEFIIASNKPRNARLPAIALKNGLFAIPIKADYGDKLTGLFEIQSIEGFENSDPNGSHQGYEIDNLNRRVFITNDNGDQQVSVYEYTLREDGGIGSLISSAHNINGGHGDYFIVQNDEHDNTFLWLMEEKKHSPNGMHNLVRIHWKGNSTTNSDIDIRIPFSSNSRPEISWYGNSDDVVIRDTNTRECLLCKLDDLIAGNLSPYSIINEAEHTTELGIGLARQNFKFHGDSWFLLSGGDIRSAIRPLSTSWMGVGCFDGKPSVTMNIQRKDISLLEEPEGLAWYWNGERFVTQITTRIPDTGSLVVYSLSNNNTKKDAELFFNGCQRDRKASASEWSYTTDLDFNRRLRMNGLAIGGLSLSSNFDPEDFVIYQSQNSGGRKQAVINAFKGLPLYFYGSDDSVYTGGAYSFRANDSVGKLGDVLLHIGASGITIGGGTHADSDYQLSLVRSSMCGLRVNSGVKPGVVINSAGYGLSFPTGQALYVGETNADNLKGEQILALSATGIIASKTIQPVADTSHPLGSASRRFSTIYAANGTINTSDGRLKTRPIPIDDAVLDAWSEVDFVSYQWIDDVINDNQDAKVYFGVIAQDVHDVFRKHGIDAASLGLLCYDEWPEEKAVISEDGVVLSEKLEAGNRWGIRYDQCMILEAALMRREMRRLK